jgi:hypothetical protein
MGTPNLFVGTSNFGSIAEVAKPEEEIQFHARIRF